METLSHELGHLLHLQLTKNTIPEFIEGYNFNVGLAKAELEAVSKKMAYELQQPNKYPLVAEAIQDMKKEMQDKYSVNMDKHLSRLDELGRKAEEEKHFSASINAEQLRGKVGGLYDPTIRLESAVENLPREELIKQLSELQKKNINIVGEENIIEHEPIKKEEEEEEEKK